MTDKIQSCNYLKRENKKKLGRISHILKIPESQLIDDALEYYFENSDVTEQAQKKITEYSEFAKDLGAVENGQYDTFDGKITIYEHDRKYKEEK